MIAMASVNLATCSLAPGAMQSNSPRIFEMESLVKSSDVDPQVAAESPTGLTKVAIEQFDKSSTTASTTRQSSPTPSSVCSLSTTATPPLPEFLSGSDLQAPPAKRRKLTPYEKEEKAKEQILKKAEKERQRAAKKVLQDQKRARQEEEKLVKDEERRIKNEEKEEKKREKDLIQQQKEQAKRIKEEEEAKKARAQSRINTFFNKPTGTRNEQTVTAQSSTATAPSSNDEEPIASIVSDTIQPPSSVVASQNEMDYSRTFLPFALQSFTIVAPTNRFSTLYDAENLRAFGDNWSEFAKPAASLALESVIQDAALHGLPPKVLPQTSKAVAAFTECLEKAHGIPSINNDASKGAFDMLESIPMKYLFFHEDVRPPYIGTQTGISTVQELAKLARNPLRKQRTELDYQYESEAEWEELDDAEDLGSEGEDDAESLADSDDIAFLDDEEAEDSARAKQRIIAKDMQPVSTGLCWDQNFARSSEWKSDAPLDLSQLSIEFISDKHGPGFDPFSTSHWPSRTLPVTITTTNAMTSPFTKAILQEPSRQPLLDRPSITINKKTGKPMENSNTTGRTKADKPPKPLGRILEGPNLEDFKSRVKGSRLTKVALLGLLKTEYFAKVPNAVLADTLSTVAERTGPNKTWQLK